MPTHFIFALIFISWPFIANLFFKTELSYLTGKWTTWDSLITHPYQFIIFLSYLWICYKNFVSKKKLTKKHKIYIASIAWIAAFLLAGFIGKQQALTISLNFVCLICGITIWHSFKKNIRKNFLNILLVGLTAVACFQSALAIAQTLLINDLGLSLLNEPNLSNLKGLATLHIGDIVWLRGYGTFSHPNVLAFFLSFTILLQLIFSKNKAKTFIIVLLGLGLLAAGSRASIYLLISVTIINFLQLKKSFFQLENQKLIQIFIIASSVLAILILRSLAPETTISNHERLNQIINFSTNKALPWQQQPIHNSYLQVIKSLPAIILIIPIYYLEILQHVKKFVFKLVNNKNLLALLSLSGLWAFTDHFFITLPIGSLFMLLIYFYSQDLLTNPQHASPNGQRV